MSSLKDLPLRASYVGTLASVDQEFFALVSAAACQYRVVLPALDVAHLLPLSLHLADFLGRGNSVRVLVQSPRRSDVAGVAEKRHAPSAERPSKQVVDLLATEVAGVGSDNLLHSAARDRQIEVRCVEEWPLSASDDQFMSRTSGFLTDEAGATVSYEADWSSNIDSGNLRVVASWSWGDPRCAVEKSIEKFDAAWEGGRSTPLEDAVRAELISTLIHLEKNPTLVSINGSGIQLFQHQRKAVDAWVGRGFRGVFKMCTGSGKTVSALACVRELSVARAGSSRSIPPVVISVPTRVLADQWLREIRRFGYHAILAAYESYEHWGTSLEPALRMPLSDSPRFIVTTYRTFADERFIRKINRAGESGVRAVWIADEMHNLASPRLRDVMKQVETLFEFRLGLSATPEVEEDFAASEYLLQYFGGVCVSYELADGIRDGVLCPYKYFPRPAYLAPDVGERYLGLLRDIGDAKRGSVAMINAYRETRDLLRRSGVQIAAFKDLLLNLVDSSVDLRHTLIYCPPGYGTANREISDDLDTDVGERRLIEEVIQTLRDHHLSASSILGETPADERTEILNRFADGAVSVLCAIGCLDEGVDVPSIQRAIVLYSVDREKQFIQRRGRILRQPKGVHGKVAEIYDIVILPHGSRMPVSQAEALLRRELRRYHQFAALALNGDAADAAISEALSVATGDLQ